MVRVLPPWFENLKKRQVRAPRIYVRDTGFLHSLLGLDTADDLYGHPKVGVSFEGFGIEQILSSFALREASTPATKPIRWMNGSRHRRSLACRV